MKRFWQLMLGIGLVLGMHTGSVRADMGPKPSVNLTLEGFEGRLCYVTLLSEESSTGPYSVNDEPIEEADWQDSPEDQAYLQAWKAFRAYEDEDGFYFIEYFEQVGEDGSFSWNYYPPDVFKVLLYFPEEDVFRISPIAKRYAFDSYYRVSPASDFPQLLIEELQIDRGGYGTHMASRVIVTILIELLIAGCFKLWKRPMVLCILIMNLLTQLLLNASLNAAYQNMSEWDCILLYGKLEVAAMLIEGVAYSFIAGRFQLSKKRVWLYVLVANVSSFLIGWQLTMWFPMWF